MHTTYFEFTLSIDMPLIGAPHNLCLLTGDMMEPDLLLYWHKVPGGNFGDDLNKYLWQRLLPDDFFSGELDRGKVLENPGRPCTSPLFLGIGTLIDEKVPDAPKKIVFGTGFGYGGLPHLDRNWIFHCVRGPRSARALGLDASYGVCDPAVLVRRVTSKPTDTATKIGFMPHHSNAETGYWGDICRNTNMLYIDPRHDVETVLQNILQCKILITEALHGAIVADTLRVPWIPVSSHQNILDFKWLDWCESIGETYQPIDIPAIWLPSHPTKAILNKAKVLRASHVLQRAARSGRPVLSRETTMNSLIDRLEDGLLALTR